ncbi:MAG: DUF2254 domain-containing protein [Planctomycetaceae bacterium]
MFDEATFRWAFALRQRWQDLRSSFWFVPAILVSGAVLLATILVGVDASVELHVIKRWPLFFGAGAEGARGLLTAVAGSMITVAGVVFSITIVALSLTSSQYTSRVLRNFMRDRVNQAVLGVFVGIFAYCLVVLRVIRGGDEGAFVPSLAVLAGLLLAFVGIAFLIYFIHHIALSIQASNIIATVASETIAAIDRLFPEGLGEEADDDFDEELRQTGHQQEWTPVPALTTGYIEGVDGDTLLAFARENNRLVRMERGIGEFVVEGTSLMSITACPDLDDETARMLNAAFVIGRQRTIHQDAGFGVRQIVDIALKALSPGINDSTTAAMCVDHLSAILVRLAPRRMSTAHRLEDGELRVIARGPTFDSLLSESFDQIRQNSAGNVAVLTRLIQAMETVASAARRVQRRQALRRQAELVRAIAERTVPAVEIAGINQALIRLAAVLEGSAPRSESSQIERRTGTENR